MKLYCADVQIAATIYVQGETPEDAQAKIKETFGDLQATTTLEHVDFTTVTGCEYSRDMPDVSFSPIATLQAFTADPLDFDLAADFDATEA